MSKQYFRLVHPEARRRSANACMEIFGEYRAETGKIKRRNRMSSGMRFPLPIQSFLRNDIMSITEFKAIPARPCIKCGATERYVSVNGAIGRCKVCAQAHSAAQRATNPENVKAINAAYRKKNADKIKARGATYYAKNSERIKSVVSAYYRSNQEGVILRALAYRTENAAEISMRKAARYRDNPEKVKASVAAYHAANPAVRRASRQNRRARLRAAEGSITKADVIWLFDLQRGTCPVCKAGLNDGYHVDHIQALSKGGSNARANLQLLCPTCNMSKSSKESLQFMQERGFLL